MTCYHHICFPIESTVNTLKGGHQNTLVTFRKNLRARHAKVKAEFDKKMAQVHNLFLLKNLDGWRTILDRVTEWRRWWDKL